MKKTQEANQEQVNEKIINEPETRRVPRKTVKIK